jgi:hydroxyacylglutathione hydrolase
MPAKLIHEILPVGWLACNCSILGDPETREALVIDPGDEVERILEAIARHGLKVRAIVSTHAHIDHVGGLARMAKATGAPVMMHENDLALYRRLATQAEWLGMPVPEMTEVDRFVREGDTVEWGGFQARVFHTPGHSQGSICLYLPTGESARETGGGLEEPRLFAGDTLFAGSIGRTDLWGGSFEEIIRSIHTSLLVLPDETLVYPGHGPATTIGEERESNPFVRLAR